MKTKEFSPSEKANLKNIAEKLQRGGILSDREQKLFKRYEKMTNPGEEKPEKKNKVGRPRKELSPEMRKSITFSLSIGASVEEVAAHAGVSRQTIYRNFVTLIKTGAAGFRCNIRRWQAIKAKKGDTGMLIWLGKQVLGQKDHQEPPQETPTVFKVEILSEKDSKPPESKPDDPEE
jgi:hypothetical protein